MTQEIHNDSELAPCSNVSNVINVSIKKALEKKKKSTMTGIRTLNFTVTGCDPVSNCASKASWGVGKL